MILLILAAATAAPPKKGPVEQLHEKVVEAIRNCPKAAVGEIVVCSRDRGIAEGARLPRLDPRFAGSNLRPNGRGTIAGPAVAASGTGSCSASGGGGAIGCAARDYRSWREERNRLREAQRAAEDPR